MAAPMNVENLQIIKEEPLEPEDMKKQLEAFLKKKHVREGLSKDKYTRLKGLMASLKDNITDTDTSANNT